MLRSLQLQVMVRGGPALIAPILGNVRLISLLATRGGRCLRSFGLFLSFAISQPVPRGFLSSRSWAVALPVFQPILRRLHCRGSSRLRGLSFDLDALAVLPLLAVYFVGVGVPMLLPLAIQLGGVRFPVFTLLAIDLIAMLAAPFATTLHCALRILRPVLTFPLPRQFPSVRLRHRIQPLDSAPRFIFLASQFVPFFFRQRSPSCLLRLRITTL